MTKNKEVFLNSIEHFIAGQLIHDESEKSHTLLNPANGQETGRVFYANENTINKAVTVANDAFKLWSQTTLTKRSQILFRFKSLVEEHQTQLAKVITQEHGKTINDALGSIARGLAVVEYACGIADHLKGEISMDAGTGVDCYSIRQPLGVCVGITPFNFPAMIALWMFPLAIACGNTFILKPSEKDPSCSVLLAQLFQQAGLPNGVLNVVHGGKETVDRLLYQPDVKAVSFVGSSPVAEYIYKTATEQHKRVQAFGGAKNHCVVMPDADLDYVTEAIMGAAYGSAGERCMAISVAVIVGDKTADKLIQQLVPKIKALKIGAGTQDDVEMGPLITKEHLGKVQSYLDIGVAEGAELVVDGRKVSSLKDSKGNFLGGSLFDRVEPVMQIYREEIFGPVLSIVRVPTFNKAIDLINAHEFGNGTAIFTQDANLARTFAKNVQVGMIGINIPIPVPVAAHSFGGWKRSLFGDIHMHGREGIQFYTKLKTITAKWPSIEKNLADYKMPVLD